MKVERGECVDAVVAPCHRVPFLYLACWAQVYTSKTELSTMEASLMKEAVNVGRKEANVGRKEAKQAGNPSVSESSRN